MKYCLYSSRPALAAQANKITSSLLSWKPNLDLVDALLLTQSLVTGVEVLCAELSVVLVKLSTTVSELANRQISLDLTTLRQKNAESCYFSR